MTWAKREAVTNLVVLGDGEDHKKKVGGLLVGCPRDRMYPDKVNYELVQKDGEIVVLSGSASLGRQINDGDVGKFVKCEFKEWGRSANGRFKVIDVNVWEGPPTEDMKKWPLYLDTLTKIANGNGKQTPAKAAAVPADDFGEREPEPDEDDGLPF
jgi:hypothetical protein